MKSDKKKKQDRQPKPPRSMKARRLLKLEELYQKNYPVLCELTDVQCDLDALKLENMRYMVPQFLPYYPKNDPLTDEAFCQWMSDLADPFRVCKLQALMADPKNWAYIREGICSVLRGAWDLADYSDPREIVDDLAWATWSKVWCKYLESLLAPNQPAKVSTRLYAIARDVAREWKTTRIRYLWKYGTNLDDHLKTLDVKQAKALDGRSKPVKAPKPLADEPVDDPKPDVDAVDADVPGMEDAVDGLEPGDEPGELLPDVFIGDEQELFAESWK